MVLFEAMGARPFAAPAAGARSMAEALRAEAGRRRRGAPHLLDIFPEAPAALGAVLDRCLAADPADRYATAEMLAADLRAVADGAPLRHARLPMAGRASAFAHRHRRRLAAALCVGLLAYLAAMTLDRARLRQARRLGEVRGLLTLADRSIATDNLDEAETRLEAIWRLAEAEANAGRLDGTWPLGTLARSAEVDALRARARDRRYYVREARAIRRRADALARAAGPLAARLGSGVDLDAASREARAALAPLYVLANPDWAELPDLALLDRPRRDRLVAAVDDLLFAWVAAAEGVDDAGLLMGHRLLCDRGSREPQLAATWRALADRLDARLAGRPADPGLVPAPSAVASARAADRWSLLAARSGRPAEAEAWADRAAALEPGSVARRLALADRAERAGRPADALEHYAAALALRPDLAVAREGVDRARATLASRPNLR